MKMYILSARQIEGINTLMSRKKDNEYLVLHKFNEYVDIVQYSAKYNNVHICTVYEKKLDPSTKLA